MNAPSAEIDHISPELNRIIASKVEDITTSEHYAHGFTRFGLKNGPRGKEIDKSTDRLKQVFKYGIVSEKFAKRIGLGFNRQYDTAYNDKFVSIGTKGVADAAAWGLVGWVDYDNLDKLDNQPTFVLLIDPNLSTSSLEPINIHGEKLRKHRVAQRFFKGLVIYANEGEVSEKGGKDELSLLVKEAVSSMQQTFGDQTELYVPIYDQYGNMLWPQNLKHEDIAEWKKEQLS